MGHLFQTMQLGSEPAPAGPVERERLDPLEIEAEEMAEWLAHRGNSQRVRQPTQVSTRPGNWGTPVHRRSRPTGGRPLPALLREDLERNLGKNLAEVRLHDSTPANREARRMGARAYASGPDIVFAEPVSGARLQDRKLIAHEVVHTVQQQTASAPDRVQQAFSHTAGEINAKVTILLKKHLRDKGGDLAKLADELEKQDSWFMNLRASLERENPKDKQPTFNEEEVAKKVVEKINEYAASDQAHGAPKRNGLASVLTDYFRINNAWKAASLVLVKFPFSMTMGRSLVVGATLHEVPGFSSAAGAAINSVWDWGKPKISPKPKPRWEDEIVDIYDQFMGLAPLPNYEKARQALIERLGAAIGDVGTDLPDQDHDNFESLKESSPMVFNELLGTARGVLIDMRTLTETQLKGILKSESQLTSVSPFELWRRGAEALLVFAQQLGSKDDRLMQTLTRKIAEPGIKASKRKYFRAYRGVAAKAEKKLKEKLVSKIEEHRAYWHKLRRLTENRLDPEVDAELIKRVQERGIDETLFHEADREVLKAFSRHVPILAAAYRDYLDLRAGQTLTKANRHDLRAAYANHPTKAAAFRAILSEKLIPPVTAVFAAAVKAKDVEKADRFGWFAQELQAAALTLEIIEGTALTSEKDVRAHDAERDNLKAHFYKLARAALTKTGEAGAAATARVEKKDIPAAASWQQIEDHSLKAQRLEFLKTSVLFVPQPFLESSDSSPSRIAEDGGSTEIRGVGPFTAQQLSELYQTQYYNRVLKNIKAGIAEAEKAGSGRTAQDFGIVGKAIEAEEQQTIKWIRPTRFESRGLIWAHYAEDEVDAFEKMLEQTESFRNWDAKVSQQSRGWPLVRFNPYKSPESDGTVWIWLLPTPAALARRVFEVPVVRGLENLPEETFFSEFALLSALGDSAVAKLPPKAKPEDRLKARRSATQKGYADLLRRMSKDGTGLALPKLSQAWAKLQKVEERSRKLNEAAGRNVLHEGKVAREFQKRFRPESRASMEDAQEEVFVEMRKATTIDRALVRQNTEKLLEEINKGRIHKANGAAYVSRNLKTFFRSVGPPTFRERRLQTAALVLEMLDALIDLYTDSRLIGSYFDDGYFFLKLAQASLEDLTQKPPSPKKGKSPAIETHSQGILWATETGRSLEKLKEGRRSSALTSALKALMQSPLEFQWRLTISGNPSGGGSLTSFVMNAPSRIEAAPAIAARNKGKEKEDREKDFIELGGGLRVRIAKIHQAFTYLPGFGDLARARRPEESGFARYSKGQVYVGKAAGSRSELTGLKPVATEDPSAIPPVAKDSQATELVDLEVLHGDKVLTTFTIRANDFGTERAGLNWLANVVHGEAAGKSFRALGTVIQGFGEGMLFIASFYPPAAAAMAAADILTFWAKMKDDPEFKKELTRIVDEPVATLEHFGTEIAKRFSITGLFDMLMNGNFDAPDFATKSPRQSKRRPMGGKKVGKLFTRLKRIAGVAAVRLEKFQDLVQGPVRRLQGEMAEHPRIAAVTNWAGRNAEHLADPVSLILRHRIAGPVYEAYALYRTYQRKISDFTSLTKPIGNTARSIEAGLERMKKFQLPATIIPLPLILNAVIELMLVLARKMKGRAKIVAFLAEILKSGADATGVMKLLLDAVADRIKGSWGDPNTHWREQIVKPLKTPIENTVQSSSDRMSALLLQIPMLGDYFGKDSFKTEAKPLPATVKPPKADPGGVEVDTSESLDGAFDSARVAELVPEETFEDVVGTPTYSQIMALPDVAQMDVVKGLGSPQKNANAGTNASPLLVSPDRYLRQALPSEKGSSSIANGEPMSPVEREDAERRFGHSFGDVRIHRGPDAAALTRAHWAHALTSGSHIFLRPGLTKYSSEGQKVLDHELSHVLQKRAGTNGNGPRSPATAGLRLRSSEERAADSMADRSRRNPTSESIPIEGAHENGASPASHHELILSFVKRISTLAGPVTLAQAVEKAHSRAKKADLDKKTEDAAEQLWSTVQTKINRLQFANPNHFGGNSGRKRIKEHLDKRLTTLPERTGAANKSVPAASQVIGHLAARRQEDVPGTANKKATSTPASGTAPKPPQRLDAKGFLTDLALYIAGRSGIVLEFDPEGNLTEKLYANPGSAVSVAVSTKHIELHFINDHANYREGLEFWNTAVKSTWPNATNPDTYRSGAKSVLKRHFNADPPSTTTASGATGGSGSPTSTGDDPAKLLDANIEQIWDKSASDLKFDHSFQNEVEAYLNPPTLDHTFIPPWPVYVGVRSGKLGTDRYKDKVGSASRSQAESDLSGIKEFNGRAVRSRAAQVGIHLSTHADLTGGGWDLGNNLRNSHHIVQYLLPEYFNNAKEFTPFPHVPSVNYPGVTANAQGRVDTIKNLKNGETIQVADTEAGRGGIMPAVLISAHAHQNSSLHVTPQKADPGDPSAGAPSGGNPTQGYAIHRKFSDYLAELAGGQKKSPAAAHQYLKANPTDPTASEKLYQAVAKTYHWIWHKEMRNDLLKTFPGVEAQYYLDQFRDVPVPGSGGTGSGSPSTTRQDALKSIHKDTATDHTAIKGGIEKVVAQCETHAIEGLKAKGWKFPA